MESEKAVEYLSDLLGRTLRIHATDGRMFVGLFKCTDAVSNLGVILIEEQEYIGRLCSAIHGLSDSANADTITL
jgi:small nuclear ribonucleoprotein (snRNP)-like protein